MRERIAINETDGREGWNVPSATSVSPLPAYDAPELASVEADALIGLLMRDEDRTPRTLVEECAGRGETMIERLSALVENDRYWNEACTRGEWWLLHAVMILGLIPGERAGLLLVSFMRRMARADDINLQDWFCGNWPALFRNKPDTVVPALRELSHDRGVDWYMRIQAVEVVQAAAERGGAQALDAALDWAAGIAADETEERTLRLSVAAGFFVKPVSPYVLPTAKIGRNDPCPCDSGKKYKKCCLPDMTE